MVTGTRRIYPKPPIVEAVIEFRLVAGHSRDAILAAVSPTLGPQYPGARLVKELIEFSATISPEGQGSTTRRVPHVTFLRSEDSRRQIGVGQALLSSHVLAPYPGWENFIEQTRDAVEALPVEVKEAGASALSVRYIDRIVMPTAEEVVGDYLTVMPSRPASMPEVLSGYHVVTTAIDPRDQTLAQLTVANAPPEADHRQVLIYDLLLQRAGTPLCTLVDTSWTTIVEELHQRQREIFEQSITDRARELFQ